MAVHELIALRGGDDRRHIRWIAPLLAAFTLAGWVVFFGGPAPPGELARQGVATAAPFSLYPQHGLYFLTCVGAYYVIGELILLPGSFALRNVLRAPSIIIAAALIVLYGIQIGRPDFFEAALLIALLGFVSTMALAKFLLRGDIIE